MISCSPVEKVVFGNGKVGTEGSMSLNEMHVPKVLGTLPYVKSFYSQFMNIKQLHVSETAVSLGVNFRARAASAHLS